MRYFLRSTFVILLTISSLWGYTQPLTTRDNEEVKLLARRKVETGLNDLLNVLSLTDLGEAERNALIGESFSAGANQLFVDKDAIIEDDINPNRAATGTVLDMPVEKYLANFDLLYTKSAQGTVRFTDVSVSNLKRANSLYVKVLFTSIFGGRNTKIDKPYGPVRRVAEVRAEQVGAKWTVAIARIAFALPADSANAPLNNAPLAEAPRRLLASADSTTQRPDSTQTATVAAPPADPEKEREKAALLAYQKLLADGKTAFDNNDLETAQRIYEQAERQQPFEDLTPKVRLFRIQRVLEERSRNSLAEQKKRLALALRKRHYADALALLQRIADQQPDSTGLDEQRRDLITKARRKAELDERFASGQYRDLVKEYGRLIDAERKQTKQTGIQTNASDWYLGRGKSQTELGEYKDALRDLNESLTLDFQNLDALESRADLYARLGDFPKAAADLSVYLTVDPTNADLLARRASYRVRTNRTAEAFADYDEAIRISNQNPRFYLLRGLLHQQTGACDKAEADFSEGINRSRRQPELYFRRGVAQVCLKDYAAAGADFGRAIELGLDHQNRARVDSIAALFYGQSDQDLQARKTPEALSQLAIALQLKPDYADAWLAAGRLYNAQNNYPRADSTLTRAIRYNPTNAAGYYERGLNYLNTNRFDPAATDFRQAVSLQPTLHNATLGEARALMGQRQYDQAQAALNGLLNQRKQLDKTYPPTFFADAFFLAGRCAYALRHYDGALDRLDEALSLAKSWATAYTERGRTYEAMGKPDRARDDYAHAAQLEPTVAAHHLPLALLLYNRDKPDEALREYSRCQELDNDHRLASVTALGKGRCYVATGKYLDALNELNQVGQYDGLPCTDECLYLRTYAQIRTGQLPTSARLGGTLTKTASPDYAPKMRYLLACAHLQANDDAQALTQLEKALQMGVAKDFLKKDPLLDFVRKDFRKTSAYSELVGRYR
ncbi:tetratricopeptide repeat protein [Fibrella aquatilis]|uniref:Tetratricopeptide repeat protein n=1 Tax=Fibrella aquatilis TaxID=2817059 RepID=A0A939G7G0_9BACT|nr:tetratricopeptide repeat protein [Fibrella aquatilis]MBO0933271.1 tetratricopeptide repeat protein [Fibrella aquatilis]